MIGRLKDFRRTVTDYDRFTCNYLTVVGLTVTICY